MPRIASLTSRSLANIAVQQAIKLFPFTGENISTSASKAQLGGGYRVANTSTWSFTASSVNFSGTGLPYHSYGNLDSPYNPGVQNYNITWTYRGGTNVSGAKDTPKDALIGLWLNGVAIYNPVSASEKPDGFITPDGFTLSASYEASQDFNYSFGQDLAGGHAVVPNRYHYHDASFFESWLTGSGHVSGTFGQTGIAECSIINYLKSGLVHPNGHSKILGISADGYPIYGPYGYDDPVDSTSGIKRMVTSYTLYPATIRQDTTTEDTIAYPMGIFIADYAYNASGDLDQHNGRYCTTPDYPEGTYAYFVTVDTEGGPVYPYVIGTSYYGSPAKMS